MCMTDVTLGPGSLAFGYKENRCLVQFERLLPVCTSRYLGAPQTSFGPVIGADEAGYVFALNTDQDSVMVINSNDKDTLNWNQLVIVRNAVGLAVGDMSVWVVTSVGDVSFIRLRKGLSVRAATQKLIKPDSICEDATGIVCVAVSETDRVFVGIQSGQIYCSSGTYTKWHRLPNINRRSSWFFGLFSRNDATIHCMAACVNALYCCIGGNYDMWRYMPRDGVGNGTWHHMNLTNLGLRCLSVSRDRFNVLLGVDGDGTLFIFRDTIDFSESDWVEISSEKWLSVAFGRKLVETSESSDDDLQPLRKKTAVSTTTDLGDCSDDEYVTARNFGFSRQQTTWESTLKIDVKQSAQRCTAATGRQFAHSAHCKKINGIELYDMR